MNGPTDVAERRIEAFLAPLQQVAPAMRHMELRRPRRPVRRVILLAAALLAIGSGVAAARALLVSSEEATRSPLSQGEVFACQGLEGIRADRAADFFAARGFNVSWRFTEYYAPGTHGGLGGFASRPSTVPPDSVVEDVALFNSSTVIVFVRAPDDPNGPPIPTPSCPAHR